MNKGRRNELTRLKYKKRHRNRKYKEILRSLKSALREVKLIEKGKKKPKPLTELLK